MKKNSFDSFPGIVEFRMRSPNYSFGSRAVALFFAMGMVANCCVAQDEKINAMAEQITTATSASTVEEQMPAFIFVHENYSRNPEEIPDKLKTALSTFLLETAKGKGPRIEIPHDCGRNSNELPLKIALRFTDANRRDTLEAAALLAKRRDLSLGLRLRSVRVLRKAGEDQKLASIGGELRKSEDRKDRAVALKAYENMAALSHEAVPFIIGELSAPSTPASFHAFRNTEQLLKLFEAATEAEQQQVLDLIRAGTLNVPEETKSRLQNFRENRNP